MKPEISLIIPVYNVSTYLRQCLDSVILQSFQDIEIIIVDDGSTDGSGSICDEYAKRDKRIKVYHTMNRGLATVRNYGLDCIHASYVMILDSDDWIEPDAVKKLYEVIRFMDSDVVACNYYYEYQDGSADYKTTTNDDICTYYNEECLKKLICKKVGPVPVKNS